jgi:electron transfer flavoprotein beta subunit
MRGQEAQLDIIVPIKQVPETGNVKMDPESGTMIRAGVETVVNPLDLYAIETAMRLKEMHGGTVTAVSMGPPQAEKAIREAIAMGCDAGVLVSDRKFGGSDTWATSYTLAQAIKKLGKFDLIITGERATDGDTAQVGPGIAAWLDVPLASYVARIDSVNTSSITVERLVEEGYQIVELQMPSLITVVKEIAVPRLPTLKGKKRSKAATVPVYDSLNIELDSSCLGLQGSPTKVVRISTPKVVRGGMVVKAQSEEQVVEAVDGLIRFLESRDLV